MRQSTNAHAGARPPSVTGRYRLPLARRRFLKGNPSHDVVLSYPMRDYAVETATTVPANMQLTTLGDPCHYLLSVAEDWGGGNVEFCGLGDGFFVQIYDTSFHVPRTILASAPDMLRIRIARDGDGEYVSAHGDVVGLEGPGAAIIIEPADQPPAEAVFAGRVIAVQVYIHRDALSRLFADSDHELPSVIRDFLAGDLPQTVARRLPLDPGLLRFLGDLQACSLKGLSRRLVIRSKAVEILCHAFDLLGQGDERRDTTTLASNGVIKAQRLLTENFIEPPSLDDLAVKVGLSRSSLCAAFRQITGQTVFDYVADLKMERALTLLLQPGMTISEIAYAVGYNHPSSFSVAVQRRFGVTASQLRRRDIPGN